MTHCMEAIRPLLFVLLRPLFGIKPLSVCLFVCLSVLFTTFRPLPKAGERLNLEFNKLIKKWIGHSNYTNA